MLLFIRDHTAEGHFTPEGVQGILRFKDRGFDAQHFELLEIPATGIANPEQRGRTLFGRTRTHAGLLVTLPGRGRVQKRVVRRRRDLQWLTGLDASKRIAARHDPIPSKAKLPEA